MAEEKSRPTADAWREREQRIATQRVRGLFAEVREQLGPAASPKAVREEVEERLSEAHTRAYGDSNSGRSEEFPSDLE